MSIIKIRKFAEKTYLPLVLAFLFTFTSCSKEQIIGNSLTKTTKMATNLTGEQIFRGLFFMQGDLANSISSLKPIKSELDKYAQINPKFTTAFNDIANSSVEAINANFPTFFKSFEEKMKSNDVYKIQEAINEANNMYIKSQVLSKKFSNVINYAKFVSNKEDYLNRVKNIDINTEAGMIAFDKLNEEYGAMFKQTTDFEQCTVGFAACVVAVVGYMYVALVHSAVVVAALKLAVAAWDYVPIIKPIGGGSDIEKEIFVKEIKDYMA